MTNVNRLKICSLIVLLASYFILTGMAKAESNACNGPGQTLSGNYTVQAGWASECECNEVIPEIDLSSTTVSRNNFVTVRIASGVTACPPFIWTISGSGAGFHFDDPEGPTGATTYSNSTSLELWADSTACGSAIITVTDACGESATISVREPSYGHWVLVHNESCATVDSQPGGCSCTNCSTVVVGGYKYMDCWWGGTRAGSRYHGPTCEKWPYTEDLSGTKCGCPGYYYPFGVVGILYHKKWEWQCY